MIVLGLLLLAGAVVVAVEIGVANDAQIDVHLWGWTWHVAAYWLAVAGGLVLAGAGIGMWMMRGGSRRAWRRRRENRALAAENRRLAKQVDRKQDVGSRQSDQPATEPGAGSPEANPADGTSRTTGAPG